MRNREDNRVGLYSTTATIEAVLRPKYHLVLISKVSHMSPMEKG